VFFNHIGKPYEPPKIPKGFPIEIGIDLYYLETSNKKAVEEVMKKYDLHGEPPHTLTTNEFIDILEKTTIRSMIKRAIVGAMPTEEDLEVLTRYLIEHIEYRPIQLDTLIYSSLPEDKVGRYIIEEDIDSHLYGDTLWYIYEWVYLVWNLAIGVRQCAADDCNKFFVPAPQGKEQCYCSMQCRKRIYMRKYRKKQSQ